MGGGRVRRKWRVRGYGEKDFQEEVIWLAGVLGWRVYHTYDSRRSEPGFPDLVLLKGDRLVFAELKVGRRGTTAAQQSWLEELREAGCDARLWRPTDWREIEALLRGDDQARVRK